MWPNQSGCKFQWSPHIKEDNVLVEVRQWALVDVEFDEVIEIYTSMDDASNSGGLDVFNEVSPGSVKLIEVTISWNN